MEREQSARKYSVGMSLERYSYINPFQEQSFTCYPLRGAKSIGVTIVKNTVSSSSDTRSQMSSDRDCIGNDVEEFRKSDKRVTKMLNRSKSVGQNVKLDRIPDFNKVRFVHA